MANMDDVRPIIAKFDVHSESLALLSSDGRLKIWDAVTGQLKQQLTEPNHLVQRYTSMAWGPARKSSGKKGKKAKLSSPDLVALGTESGVTVVWDLLKSEVRLKLGEDSADGHTDRVEDVVFSHDGSSLYSCGADKKVIEWNMSSGSATGEISVGKTAPAKIALNPEGTLLAVGGLRIKLLDTASKKSARTLDGHAFPVSCMAFSSSGSFLVSACRDRYISLWATGPGSEGKTAVAALSMQGSPIFMTLHESAEDQECEDLMALDDSGKVNIWRLPESDVASTGGSRKAAVSQAKRLQSITPCVVSAPAGDSIVACTLAASGPAIVAHGSELKPTLQLVRTPLYPPPLACLSSSTNARTIPG